MSNRAPPAASTRLHVLVANVLHLPPGDVEQQPPGADPNRGAQPPHGRPRAGRSRPHPAILRRSASDDRLMELAGLGDERAWEALMQRHQAYLQACCRPIVGESAAQDAVQQAFVGAWHALLRGCEVRNPRAWLVTIARRAALQMLREQGPRQEPLPTLAPAEHPAHDQHELFARARAALAAVAALPAHERDALVWTSLHGRSTRETASALGLSEGALRQLVFRARARARAAVGGVVPSTLLGRLFGLISHAGRRAGGRLQRELPAPLALHAGEGLTKLAPVLAAGVLVGAPLAAMDLAPHRTGNAPAPPASASRAEIAGTQSGNSMPALGRRSVAPRRVRGAPSAGTKEQGPGVPGGVQARESSPRALSGPRGAALATAAAGDARPAPAGQAPSGNQGVIPPAVTNAVPAVPPAPSPLPAAPAPSAPSLPLPSPTGVTQQLANTAGQVGQTATVTTGALLGTGHAVGTAGQSALPAVPSAP